MKINKDSVMDPFKKLPLEIALEILTVVPVESVLHCKSICRNWRKIVDIHFHDHFKKLPYETRLDILSRLPGDTVLDCKSVCRNWRKIVGVVSKDPLFIRMHLYQLNHPSAAEDSCKLGFLALTERAYYYFEYNDDQNHELTKPVKKIREINSASIGVGSYSCNGLICLARDDIETPVCIFNPLTREYVMLPELRNHIESIDKSHDWDDWSFGFGYISATNEYKVVGIYVSDYGYLEVYIYTVGTNGWRDLGRNFSLEFRPTSDCIHGSFANGALYWIGNEVQKIVIFDLIKEKFCEHLAPPPLPPSRNLNNQTIGVLDGVLYIAVYVEDGCYDIWLLKKKNDNHDKKGDKHQSFEWSKELRVADNELLAVTKSGGVLTYSNTAERVWDFKEEVVLRVFPHKNTFVSLKDLGEEKTKKLKSVKGGRKP